MKGDVNDWKGRLTRSPYCKKWSDNDRELFLKFAEDAKVRAIGDRRIERNRCDLSMLTKICGMTPGQAIKGVEGLKKAVMAVNGCLELSAETKKTIKRTLGSFYCFHVLKERSMHYAPRDVKELCRHAIKAADKRLAKPIMTRAEIRELLKYGDTEDKAMLMLLFESGMRIGEFKQLHKSDITEIQEGLEVRVPPGKIGERKVVVVEATRYVMNWLAENPDKSKNPSLWPVALNGKELGAAAVQKRIRRMVERLNNDRKKKGLPAFTKPYNLHNFRHSRASELGGEKGMTEQILCKYFGWEIGSEMPRTYLHLTDEQVKKAVLVTYGKSRPDEAKEIVIA